MTNFTPDPKPPPGKKGGVKPRQQGNNAERQVAKITGGNRIPMSGAIKMGNHNLTGDVMIKAGEKPLVKMEVKMSGTLTASGDASYTLKKSVLQQMTKEADDAGEIGALFIHFKNQPYDDGYIIMQAKHWLKFLELAKLGMTVT